MGSLSFHSMRNRSTVRRHLFEGRSVAPTTQIKKTIFAAARNASSVYRINRANIKIIATQHESKSKLLAQLKLV